MRKWPVINNNLPIKNKFVLINRVSDVETLVGKTFSTVCVCVCVFGGHPGSLLTVFSSSAPLLREDCGFPDCLGCLHYYYYHPSPVRPSIKKMMAAGPVSVCLSVCPSLPPH